MLLKYAALAFVFTALVSAQASEEDSTCFGDSQTRVDFAVPYPGPVFSFRHQMIQRQFGIYANEFLTCQSRYGHLEGEATRIEFTVTAAGTVVVDQVQGASRTTQCYVALMTKFKVNPSRCGKDIPYTWDGQFPLATR